MRISTFFYCVGQGLKNIFRNIWYSLASVGTMAACIFLFCLLYSVVINVGYMTVRMESMVGITVFFDEKLTEQDILALGEKIKRDRADEVASMTYTSAEQAWENFKDEYFAGAPELAEGFAGDNPLADSASYEIYLKEAHMQEDFVAWLEAQEGVRRVNYSSLTAEGLTAFRNVLAIVSLALIGVLLCVSVFLIGNTVSAAIVKRKEEIWIMRWIGAENSMIRAPFVIEGLLIGLIGSAIPLIGTWYGYELVVELALEKLTVFAGLLAFLPAEEVFRVLTPVGLGLGVGMGLVGSRASVRRHLRV
ncbi:MAG: permease-like cell division protein FtsX [Lachnospiraceae bacterium]|jgi:cell division transport system permease protein|nr:permease-like cell division protein FtsX [Lachnospiraceae bacterium]